MSEITSDSLNRDLIAQKNAEIERLKESAKYDAFLREKYRQLITELADALWGATCDMYGGAPEKTPELIQRAREATR